MAVATVRMGVTTQLWPYTKQPIFNMLCNQFESSYTDICIARSGRIGVESPGSVEFTPGKQ